MRSPTRSRSAPAGVACALAAAALLAPVASAQAPEDQLRATLAAQMAQAPAASGLHVVDLTDGHLVFDDRGRDKLLSASVNKLYTTATALLELGPRTRVPTQLLATGRRAGSTWRGDLYLRGRGDFTFGTAAFARKSYGSHATVEGLAADLRRAGLRRIDGRVLGDASYFSDNGGTPFQLALCQDPMFGRGCPYGVAGRFERPMPNGPRTPIGMDRGLRDDTGAALQKKPSRFAARCPDARAALRGGRRDRPRRRGRDARGRAHARDDALAEGLPPDRADQQAVGQLRGRLDAPAPRRARRLRRLPRRRRPRRSPA